MTTGTSTPWARMGRTVCGELRKQTCRPRSHTYKEHWEPVRRKATSLLGPSLLSRKVLRCLELKQTPLVQGPGRAGILRTRLVENSDFGDR